MDSLKAMFLCMGLLCIVLITSAANPKPDDNSESAEIYQEVEINTSFGVQIVSVNYDFINFYRDFQADTAYVDANDFSKSSLLDVWSIYQSIELDEEVYENTSNLIVEIPAE